MFSSLYLKNSQGNRLYINHYFCDADAPNLIFCCTPILSVDEVQICYEPFISHGFNIFAIDFSGIGKSEGSILDFSQQSVIEDFHTCISHIKANFSDTIFLFGDTGIGGILAQAYAASSQELTGFAQFGCGIYQDISPLGLPHAAGLFIYHAAKLAAQFKPSASVPFKAPPYRGYHADLDNSFYDILLKKSPDAFIININFLITLLGLFFTRDSMLKHQISCPTLVFKTNHDRYFDKHYFDQYYDQLTCQKHLVEIDDVHNSYYFYPERFAQEVSNWFHKQL